ncbi:sugar ABC transporter substrate-binding protein [Synergistales bacterium]|nr:sugar ABC transporter substrate-binding protein [Synergistales bacterium]
MSKKLWGLVIVALFYAFAGCAFAADKPLVVGFSQIGAESGWRTAETESVISAAKELGIDLKFSDAQQKQENQIKAIRSFVAQGVDGILLAPVVETGWEPILNEVKKAKIPVILLDRGITVDDESLYVCKITSDFVFEGKTAAEWTVKELGGQGNVVQLQGTPGASAATERQKGFEDELTKTPGVKILESQTGDFTMELGKQVMEAFLKKYGKDINVVYAHNDDMGLGAIQAIKEAGFKPGEDIKIITVDATKAAFEAMVAGDMNAVVECNPLLGPLAYETLKKAIAGETIEKWIVQKDELFTKDQAASVIGSRKY